MKSATHSAVISTLRKCVAALVCSLAGQAAQGLEWEIHPGYRTAVLPTPPPAKTGFTLLPGSKTGILFTNVLGQERGLTNQILLNGSGVAAGDVDGDGLCDLYFCNLDGDNTLFKNLGAWRFRDVTAEAGVACRGFDATGAVLVDIDGDGDLDLLVNAVGKGTHCYVNDGKGHFKDVTDAFGLASRNGSTSMALADIDGDGFLDLYVANYQSTTLRDRPDTRFTVRMVEGKPTIIAVDGRRVGPDLEGRFSVGTKGNVIEDGQADLLFHNRGGTNFAAASFIDGSFLDEAGAPLKRPLYDWGLSVMFRDINRDGLPDIYVCNDFHSPDRLWINRGHGKFQAANGRILRKTSFFSMGIDFADINRDGFDDFFVLDMLSRDHLRRNVQVDERRLPSLTSDIGSERVECQRNTLFLNRGDGTFAEVANYAGLVASEWSWTPLFLDVDLDGYEDLIVSTGFERDGQNLDLARELEIIKSQKKLSPVEQVRLRKMYPRLETGIVAFRNRGDLTFEPSERVWGLEGKRISQGLVTADLDNDGDLDLIINNLNSSAAVFRNDATNSRVSIRLVGAGANTRGIGARISVKAGTLPWQSQEVISGGRYLSSDEAQRTFAAPSDASELTIEVNWPGGKRTVINRARPGRLYEVAESAAGHFTKASSPPQTPLFEDVSGKLGHRHQATLFDDFQSQPLLPKKLSELGPGAAWVDLDGDGREELVIGGGRGGAMAVYRHDRDGQFRKADAPVFNDVLSSDQTGLAAWVRSDGTRLVLAGSANYETRSNSVARVGQYDLTTNKKTMLIEGSHGVTALAVADMDGDGELDLFVGGHVIPGRYPQTAPAALYRQKKGQLVFDQKNSGILARVGYVTSAIWTDLQGDGFVDLVLACEWGPVRIFLNDGVNLVEATDALGLAGYRGWWTGIAAGDFDGDGRMDFVAANWGDNTKFGGPQRVRLYYGDFDHNGTMDMVEAYLHAGRWLPTRGLTAMAAGWPGLREKFPTHAAYGTADVEQMLGREFSTAGVLDANGLESRVFLNRGTRFEVRSLPLAAQLAPGFGPVAADFDGDGNTDLFMSQNCFGLSPETPRYDDGRGLFLRGDGKGGFTAASSHWSGLEIPGEQRGAAVCDYDEDGRLDLVITQRSSETKLYRNVGAHPGLRIRLEGPVGNPDAVGASIRLSGPAPGPACEIHNGTGWWSQDSPVQILQPTNDSVVTPVFIRWPGGRTHLVEVPGRARDVRVRMDGHVTVLR